MLELLLAIPWDPSWIGYAFSGTSASIAVTRYLTDSRSINVYSELRDKLANSTVKKLIQKRAKDEVTLLEAMQYSAMLVGPLRWKLQARLLLVLAIILSLFGLISIDLPGSVLDAVPSVEVFDLPFLVAQIAIATLKTMPWLIRYDERRLLENISVLHHWYYNEYVFAAIVEFNNELESLPAFRAARGSSKAEALQLRDPLRKNLEGLRFAQDVEREPHVSFRRRLQLKSAHRRGR